MRRHLQADRVIGRRHVVRPASLPGSRHLDTYRIPLRRGGVLRHGKPPPHASFVGSDADAVKVDSVCAALRHTFKFHVGGCRSVERAFGVSPERIEVFGRRAGFPDALRIEAHAIHGGLFPAVFQLHGKFQESRFRHRARHLERISLGKVKSRIQHPVRSEVVHDRHGTSRRDGATVGVRGHYRQDRRLAASVQAVCMVG